MVDQVAHNTTNIQYQVGKQFSASSGIRGTGLTRSAYLLALHLSDRLFKSSKLIEILRLHPGVEGLQLFYYQCQPVIKVCLLPLPGVEVEPH